MSAEFPVIPSSMSSVIGAMYSLPASIQSEETSKSRKEPTLPKIPYLASNSRIGRDWESAIQKSLGSDELKLILDDLRTRPLESLEL